MGDDKKCKSCGNKFRPFNSLVAVCSTRCAVDYSTTKRARADAAKAKRREHAERKRALQTIPELTKKAQRAFNLFIRTRDRGLPCISCGATFDPRPNKWDAGHFRSVGSNPEIRFLENNCHGQCKRCNRFESGSRDGYEAGIVARYDQRYLDDLKGPHQKPRYRHEELREIAKTYNRKARELSK